MIVKIQYQAKSEHKKSALNIAFKPLYMDDPSEIRTRDTLIKSHISAYFQLAFFLAIWLKTAKY